MEEELNYLSETIEFLEGELLEGRAYLVGDSSNKDLLESISKLEKEIRLLNNILSALTINELNK